MIKDTTAQHKVMGVKTFETSGGTWRNVTDTSTGKHQQIVIEMAHALGLVVRCLNGKYVT